jgi:hypothetical protein
MVIDPFGVTVPALRAIGAGHGPSLEGIVQTMRAAPIVLCSQLLTSQNIDPANLILVTERVT